MILALSSSPSGQIEHKSVMLSVRPLLACSLPAQGRSPPGGVVEMLRKSSSHLIGWFDTAVACHSDLCVMPTYRSRVRQTQSCSLCLSHSRMVEVEPPPC